MSGPSSKGLYPGYEDIHLKGCATLPELVCGLREYSVFYNTERPHQALDYRIPKLVHCSGDGGRAGAAPSAASHVTGEA